MPCGREKMEKNRSNEWLDVSISARLDCWTVSQRYWACETSFPWRTYLPIHNNVYKSRTTSTTL